MTPDQFAFWLQGYFELSDSNNLTGPQVKMIKEHLALTLTKVTPQLTELKEPYNWRAC